MNVSDIASASAIIKQELIPLFEKVGEGAEYGFGIFVRQAYVNAFTAGLWIMPGVLLIYAGYRCLKNYQMSAAKNPENYYGYHDEDGWLIIALVCALFGVAISVAALSIFIAGVVNPEYQAIRLIIESVR